MLTSHKAEALLVEISSSSTAIPLKSERCTGVRSENIYKEKEIFCVCMFELIPKEERVHHTFHCDFF